MVKKKSTTKTPEDTSNKPWVANYPPLREWLTKHNARCMWQTPREERPHNAGYDWSPIAYIECYLIGTRLAIIVVHANKHGWEIYTAGGSNKVAETLADANARLGLE